MGLSLLKDTSYKMYAIGKKQQDLQLLDILVDKSVYLLNYRPECLEVANFAVFSLLHS